ncbi:MAG: thermonuclease family protein, partial [Acidimicrobiales bacterium]
RAAARAAKEPAPAAAEPAPTGPKLWVDPDGAICPTSHPVKAKLASGIFHLPGMTAYERTTPDRCYQDEAAAESDGLRKAKR